MSAPARCASTTPGRSTGRMPENVSVSGRASAAAGLAKDVEAVNQSAAVTWSPTRHGTARRSCRSPAGS